MTLVAIARGQDFEILSYPKRIAGAGTETSNGFTIGMVECVIGKVTPN